MGRFDSILGLLEDLHLVGDSGALGGWAKYRDGGWRGKRVLIGTLLGDRSICLSWIYFFFLIKRQNFINKRKQGTQV